MFVILGAIAVAAALGVITQKRVVYSALCLLLNLCALAGLYILLNAQFIAVAQIIVYAGAIVVLFLFGIMLLSEDWEDFKAGRMGWLQYPAIVLAVVLIVQVVFMLSAGVLGAPGEYTQELFAQNGNVWMLGRALFTDYLIPFELASLLLLAAIVGAVFLGDERPEI